MQHQCFVMMQWLSVLVLSIRKQGWWYYLVVMWVGWQQALSFKDSISIWCVTNTPSLASSSLFIGHNRDSITGMCLFFPGYNDLFNLKILFFRFVHLPHVCEYVFKCRVFFFCILVFLGKHEWGTRVQTND